jgi:ABC-2 type transport system permease protein
MTTLWRLTVANLRSLTRDRAALFWTFFFPIMFVCLFGVLFSGAGDSKISVGWVDQDGSPVSKGMYTSLVTNSPILDLQVGSLDDEKAAMAKGNISAIFVIPANFAADVAAKKSVSMQVYTDPTKTQSSQVVMGIATQVKDNFNLGLAGGTEVLTLAPQTLTSTTLSNVGYLVPSILAMALMQLGVFAAIPLVQQREKGILKRIGATPLARWKLVGSNVLLRLGVAVVDALLITGIGLALFNVQILGSVLAVAGIVLLGAGAFLAIGFLMASFLKTEEQATGVVQVVQMPMMFLSGIFFSFEFMPNWLQSVGRLLPLTYLADALRQIMVNGTPVAPIGLDLAILAGWMVVCFAVAARTFRWE